MDIQPPMNGQLAVFNFASFILPTDEYATRLANFPATNCTWYWGTEGDFYIDLSFYEEGKKVGSLRTTRGTQRDCIEAEVDELASFFDRPLGGIIVSEFYHSVSIPAELYFVHIHRKSGAYIVYPAMAYAGDELYPEAHTQQLENTLFWPGLVSDDRTEVSIVVVNPYKVSFSYQLSLLNPQGRKEQTSVMKIKPFTVARHRIDETFPDYSSQSTTLKGRCSVCVAAQYKVICYAMLMSRETGVITTIDHLHPYCLY